MKAVEISLSVLALGLIGAPAWAQAEKAQEKAENKGPQQTAVEPETKIVFPATITVPDGKMQALAGTGAVRKPGEKEPAYAVGLYFDAAKAQQVLANYKGKDAASLQKDAEFYRQLMSEEIPKSLRIVMARDIKADDLNSSLGTSVEERMKTRAEAKDASTKETETKQAMDKFHGLFKEDLKQGTVLLFSWDRGGKLTATSNGKPIGTVESPAVSWALFDAYMGTNPISDKARMDAYGGISRGLEQKGQKEEKKPADKDKENPPPPPAPAPKR